MKHFWWVVALIASICPGRAQDHSSISNATTRLIQAATNSSFAYERLTILCDRFGPRLSGSTNLELSIDWILAEMQKDGLENVKGEPVMVPHWVRGEESLEMVSPRPHRLELLGLGGSVATPAGGITAEVLVVKSLADLTNQSAQAKGRIVVINEPFTEYGRTVQIRTRGPSAAAGFGAVACLVRSVTPFSMQTPHTGSTRYDPAAPKIPAAAITIEDVEFLQRLQDRGQSARLRLRMEARTLKDAPSRNVIAEIRGRENPEEIVIISGHIDSWDVGQGAMDDGGGCVAAWEAVRLMHKLKLRPRRTVRVVLWTNEENGLAGAKAYRQAHLSELPKHVLAIESDEGVFRPEAFAFSGTAAARQQIERASRWLQPIAPMKIHAGAGGADISVMEPDGVPLMDLVVDRSKYFWYHHTRADTIEVIDKTELNQCVAAMAVMAYAVAEDPERLPRP